MVFWLFLVIIAFVALVFASIVDIKIREVPNWISYSLVITGLGLRLIYSLITSDFSYLIYGLVGFAAFFVFSNLMYYTKQWGGGDAKLLMGLGAMFGNYSNVSLLGFEYKLPFLAVLLINIFVAGTLYGIGYSIFLGLKHKDKVLKEIKNKSFILVKIASLVSFSLIVLSLLFIEEYAYPVIILAIMLFLAVVILSFVKIIENVCLYKFIPVNKLVAGDWLAKNVTNKNRTICKVRNIGLTPEDISILKQNKIKNVFIKEGIPFVPGFLIGFLLTILFGDFLFLFV